jgi:hypothetical protein
VLGCPCTCAPAFQQLYEDHSRQIPSQSWACPALEASLRYLLLPGHRHAGLPWPLLLLVVAVLRLPLSLLLLQLPGSLLAWLHPRQMTPVLEVQLRALSTDSFCLLHVIVFLDPAWLLLLLLCGLARG